MSDTEILSRLNVGFIEEEAARAAEDLIRNHFAELDISPGDATRYRFMIGGKEIWVALLLGSMGRSYPWNGYHLTSDYAAEKWADGHRHTGVVVATLLNAISARLPEGFFAT